MSGLIWPKIELDRAFMPVLVTSNFDDNSIKNEQASMETPFSHYKSMGNFLDAQGQLTPYSVVRSGQNSNSLEILCMSSLPASIKRIESKATEKRWRHHFPHYKSMGAFCCHLPKNIMQPFPTPSDATHKIWSRLANWLQRYRKTGNFRVIQFSRNFTVSSSPQKLKSTKYFRIFEKLVLRNLWHIWLQFAVVTYSPA